MSVLKACPQHGGSGCAINTKLLLSTGRFLLTKGCWFLLRLLESRDVKPCGLRSFLGKVAGAEVVSHTMRNRTGRQEREALSRCSKPLRCHNMAGDQCLYPSSATFNDASYCNFFFCFVAGQSSQQHQ